MRKDVRHLIVKYKDSVAPSPGTLALHRDILTNKGGLWIGKFGTAVGKNVVASLLRQIKSGLDTYLILIPFKNELVQIAYASKILDIRDEAPPSEFSPEYYVKHKVGTYFFVKDMEEVSMKILGKLIGDASGEPISKTIFKGTATVFGVWSEYEFSPLDF